MRKWTLVLVGLLAMAFCAQVAMAKKGAGAGEKGKKARGEKREGDKKGGRRGAGSAALLGVLDADKDGALSADEITKAAEAIKKLDKDGDGQVSAKELQPERKGTGAKVGGKGKGGKGGGRRGGKKDGGKKGAEGRPRRAGGDAALLKVLDADKDGALSADEITKAAEAIKELDKDGDGQVSAKELQPRRKGADAKAGGKGKGGKGGGRRGGKKGGGQK